MCKKICQTTITILLLQACSSKVALDEQVVADIPSNPKVSQQPLVRKSPEIMRGESDFRPIRPAQTTQVRAPSGSLFSPRKAIGLYQPSSHYSVGDMILVRLEEKTSATKSLNYRADKSGRFALEPVTLNLGPVNVGNNDLNADYEQEKEFDSSAQTKQKNFLKGDITVYVWEVMNNGNLIVAGEKWITLNKGEEYIRFSGEVRIEDVALDNTISSVKVGNARIEFSGKGEMQENQSPSLISKLFGIID
jgi:flagellar L-ring protein precursor FlgH